MIAHAVQPHAWNWGMPMCEQAKCWCRPAIDTSVLIDGHGIVMHRPDPEYVFWVYGEQGPQLHAEWIPQ